MTDGVECVENGADQIQRSVTLVSPTTQPRLSQQPAGVRDDVVAERHGNRDVVTRVTTGDRDDDVTLPHELGWLILTETRRSQPEGLQYTQQ